MNNFFITNFLRKQILNRHPYTALRTMKSLPSFQSALVAFVQEESRLQAELVVDQKDPNRATFTLDTLREFSYKEQLSKLQKTSPLLVASIVGTLSKSRRTEPGDISRKGFGGSNRGEDVDLIPCTVQSISRIVRNRHPSSISILPCMNSLYLWTNRVPGQLFNWFNSLGDSFRWIISLFSPKNHSCNKIIETFAGSLEHSFQRMDNTLDDP